MFIWEVCPPDGIFCLMRTNTRPLHLVHMIPQRSPLGCCTALSFEYRHGLMLR